MKSQKERFILDSAGMKTDVILPLSDYEKLLEDIHDLAVIAERRNEEPVSMDEMKKKLYKNE